MDNLNLTELLLRAAAIDPKAKPRSKKVTKKTSSKKNSSLENENTVGKCSTRHQPQEIPDMKLEHTTSNKPKENKRKKHASGSRHDAFVFTSDEDESAMSNDAAEAATNASFEKFLSGRIKPLVESTRLNLFDSISAGGMDRQRGLSSSSEQSTCSSVSLPDTKKKSKMANPKKKGKRRLHNATKFYSITEFSSEEEDARPTRPLAAARAKQPHVYHTSELLDKVKTLSTKTPSSMPSSKIRRGSDNLNYSAAAMKSDSLSSQSDVNADFPSGTACSEGEMFTTAIAETSEASEASINVVNVPSPTPIGARGPGYPGKTCRQRLHCDESFTDTLSRCHQIIAKKQNSNSERKKKMTENSSADDKRGRHQLFEALELSSSEGETEISTRGNPIRNLAFRDVSQSATFALASDRADVVCSASMSVAFSKDAGQHDGDILELSQKLQSILLKPSKTKIGGSDSKKTGKKKQKADSNLLFPSLAYTGESGPRSSVSDNSLTSGSNICPDSMDSSAGRSSGLQDSSGSCPSSNAASMLPDITAPESDLEEQSGVCSADPDVSGDLVIPDSPEGESLYRSLHVNHIPDISTKHLQVNSDSDSSGYAVEGSALTAMSSGSITEMTGVFPAQLSTCDEESPSSKKGSPETVSKALQISMTSPSEDNSGSSSSDSCPSVAMADQSLQVSMNKSCCLTPNSDTQSEATSYCSEESPSTPNMAERGTFNSPEACNLSDQQSSEGYSPETAVPLVNASLQVSMMSTGSDTDQLSIGSNLITPDNSKPDSSSSGSSDMPSSPDAERDVISSRGSPSSPDDDVFYRTAFISVTPESTEERTTPTRAQANSARVPQHEATSESGKNQDEDTLATRANPVVQLLVNMFRSPWKSKESDKKDPIEVKQPHQYRDPVKDDDLSSDECLQDPLDDATGERANYSLSDDEVRPQPESDNSVDSEGEEPIKQRITAELTGNHVEDLISSSDEEFTKPRFRNRLKVKSTTKKGVLARLTLSDDSFDSDLPDLTESKQSRRQESSEEDDLESFFQKMKTPAKPKAIKESVPSMGDFIVDDDDESLQSEQEEEPEFYINTDRKFPTPSRPRIQEFLTDDDEDSSENENPRSIRTSIKRNTSDGKKRVREASASPGILGTPDQFISSDEEDFKTPAAPIAKTQTSLTCKPDKDRPRMLLSILGTPMRKPLSAKQLISNSSVPGAVQKSKFTFLKSLSCDADDERPLKEAVRYVKDFKKLKEELTQNLFRLYNETVFNNDLPSDLSILWNTRLYKTAGYCKYKRSQAAQSGRTVQVELSVKVCDSAERVRDTLIHELCHAAVWLFYGKTDGHGPKWRHWANKANLIHRELPVISRCHNYEIATKYIYKCTKCSYEIGRHSKSLDTEKKVCGYCRSPFSCFTKTKQGLVDTQKTPRTPNAFALFVKENYGSVKRSGAKHSHKDVMATLSVEFAKKNSVSDKS